MDLSNLASHIRTGLAAEALKRGTPKALAGMGQAVRLQYPDGAVSYIAYDESAMQWTHTVA